MLVPVQPDGHRKFTTGCDNIKSALVNLSVNYDNAPRRPAPKPASRSAIRRSPPTRPNLAKTIAAAVKAHGYPANADPNQINYR